MEKNLFHVLLVEDDDTLAILFRRLMEDSLVPHILDRVTTGDQALAYVRSGSPRPNLSVLDLALPGIKGLDVLSHLKEDEDLRAIPVVVFSVSSAASDRTEAYQRFANSYVVKPIGYDRLSRLVAVMMEYWGVWNQPGAAQSPRPARGGRVWSS